MTFNYWQELRDTFNGAKSVKVLHVVDGSEFEIQSELYQRLKELCLKSNGSSEVKAEVTADVDGVILRFDLMLFRMALPVLGIEVKTRRAKSSNNHNRDQAYKYALFYQATGIETIYCCGRSGIEPALRYAAEWLEIK